jgi:hypothetical protein
VGVLGVAVTQQQTKLKKPCLPKKDARGTGRAVKGDKGYAETKYGP